MIRLLGRALLLSSLLLSTHAAELPRQSNSLTEVLARQLPPSEYARVGIYLLDLQQAQAWSLNNNPGYPLLSSFKLPLAIWVLKLVETGQLSLEQAVPIQRSALMQDTWSPLLDEHKAANFTLTVRELLRYSVELSDNNAADVLLQLSGGTAALQQYLQQQGLQNTVIQATEQQMHQGFAAQYRNHSRPSDMALLLAQLANTELSQAEHSDLLVQWLRDTPTGAKRVKAGLPDGSIWLHKTGTSGTDERSGVRAAVNDIGLLQLPDGRQFVLVMLVQDSHWSLDDTEALMARLTARLVETAMRPIPVPCGP